MAASPMLAHIGGGCIVTGVSGLVHSSWRLRLLFTFLAATWHGFPTAIAFPETPTDQLGWKIQKADCL